MPSIAPSDHVLAQRFAVTSFTSLHSAALTDVGTAYLVVLDILACADWEESKNHVSTYYQRKERTRGGEGSGGFFFLELSS